jgi:hypothetical protein
MSGEEEHVTEGNGEQGIGEGMNRQWQEEERESQAREGTG